ncbi:MAG: phage terminase large subunit [Sinimarinibacterium flocculans]|uniref:phage terminase large subunit n=1 Tax=Sinimarinibacterium flocculans TaxID=985250 RepID=UPI003C541F58
MKLAPELKRISRKAFRLELAALGEEQRALISARVTGFEVNPAASAARKRRCKSDFRFFCETYFPHFVDARVAPSDFQAHCYRLVPALMLRPGVRTANVGPRGEGKSTLLVQLHALWRLVNGYSRYIGLFMDAKEQGEMMLDAVKAELEANPRLRQDFPQVCGKGSMWRTTKIITADGRVMIEVFGAGKRVRGRRFGAFRPDLALIDDLENDELVRSKEQRDKREDWLRKVVGNLGPPDGSMTQCYVGTLLHVDAVLARTLKNPLWKANAYVYPSIVRWPDSMDLWDQWEAVLLNEDEDAADAFYRTHRRQMDAGAKVSWPGTRPLIVLMKLRAEDHKAFETEHQHNPLAAEGCPFSGALQFYVHIVRGWKHFGAHDPSMGRKGKRGDPAATLVGGYSAELGKLHLLEAIVARRTPNKQIADIIRLQADWRCLLWHIESVAFQEFFRQQLVAQSAAQHVHVPARPFPPEGTTRDKELAIESLQPHVANGLILFNRNHRTLNQQLEYWPQADHDDGPDALEMLWQAATRGLMVLRSPRQGRRRSESSRLLQGH